jgi:Na+/glutamate symporter
MYTLIVTALCRALLIADCESGLFSGFAVAIASATFGIVLGS